MPVLYGCVSGIQAYGVMYESMKFGIVVHSAMPF